MITLLVKNVFTDIKGDFPTSRVKELEKELSFRPQGFQFTNLYNTWIRNKQGQQIRRVWDGWKRQFWSNTKRTYFPTGLLSLVQKFLTDNTIPYKILDLRVKPEKNIDLSLSDSYKLRDYQSKVVQVACEKSRGIIQASTSSGKTVIFSGIIKELGVSPFIIFVTSIDLLTQAKESLEACLKYNNCNLRVGQIGGGVIDIADINVMTVQTAVRALGKKWDQKTKFDSDDTDDKTPIEQRREDIQNLLHSAKGAISDEVQHWRSDVCQLVSKSLKDAYYTYGASVRGNSMITYMDIDNNVESVSIQSFYEIFGSDVGYVDVSHHQLKTKSVDTNSGKIEWQIIKGIWKHKNIEPIISLQTIDSRTISITGDHSIFVLNNGKMICKKGNEVEDGDLLLSIKSYNREVQPVPVVILPAEESPDFVYDLSVEKNENFFANGLLVHNSATPYRDEGDDLMIQACFGKKICEITASQLIREGWLVRPDIAIVNVKGKKSNFKTWQQIYKDRIVENDYYNNLVASLANNYINAGRLVLVLVQQINHGKTLESLIDGSVFLSGQSPKKKREEGIKKLRNKYIRCIISTVIYDEGIDVRPLDTVILAGGGKSKVRAMQRIGRITRTFEGKTKATAIDLRVHDKFLLEHSIHREKMYRTEPEYNVQEYDQDTIFT